MIIGGDRKYTDHDLTALNAESAEQEALLLLTRHFTPWKEAGHARLTIVVVQVGCQMQNRNATDKLNQQCSKLAYHKFQYLCQQTMLIYYNQLAILSSRILYSLECVGGKKKIEPLCCTIIIHLCRFFSADMVYSLLFFILDQLIVIYSCIIEYITIS